MNEKEVRYFPVEDLRVDDRDGAKRLQGYAAVFNRTSEDLGGFIEEIEPGAFRKSIESGDIYAFWSHKMDQVLGRTKSGTLKLSEDAAGLRFDLLIPDTQLGRDAHELIKRGDVTGVSFGFKWPLPDQMKWERGEGGKLPKARLLEIDLFEISPTAFPAYPQTSVVARSTQVAFEAQRAVWTEEATPKIVPAQTRDIAEIRAAIDERERADRFKQLRAL